MKPFVRLFLALSLALALASPALAINKQATVTGTASVILTPGPNVRIVVIQNPSTSTGAVSVSIDGTNLPTATVGIILQPGQQMILTSVGGQGSVKIIRAILVSGAATLNISTDDLGSS